MLSYSYTILYVESVEQTITFYEKAFGFIKKFMTPEGDYGELLSGDTTIAFASLELGESNLKNGFIPSHRNNKPFGIELTFVSSDIKADFNKAIQEGAIVIEDLTVKPWGQTVGYIKDINGFLIEICTPISN